MLWIKMTLKSSWSLNPSKPPLLLSYWYSRPLSWGWKAFSSRALPFGVSFRAWMEIQRLQGGNEENCQMKRHWTSLLPSGNVFFIEWRHFTIAAISLLFWESHLIVPQSLQTGDRKPGDRLPALCPIFQSHRSEQAKMSCTLESDLAFLDTCNAGWLTMTVSCIRNNYIPLAAPASTPTSAPQIRSPLIYRGRIFERGGDWWLPFSEKLKHFIVKSKGKRHSK